MGEIICFGLGYLVDSYLNFLNSLDYKIAFFVDNSVNLVGTQYKGYYVYSPTILEEYSLPILISCIYKEEITEQLRSYGMEERIISIEDIIYNSGLFNKERESINRNADRIILLDIFGSDKWAGTEMWSLRLAQKLQEKGKRVCLFTANDMVKINSDIMIEEMYRDTAVLEMIKYMERNLPLVFINNFSTTGILAALYIKLKYPNDIKIISVVHCDEKGYIKRHMLYKSFFDKVFCVSMDIMNRVKDKVENDKLYTKTQPIDIAMEYKRNSEYTGKINIGYAARLVKQQKRADLLIELIKNIEEYKIDYQLNIAGSGECYYSIKKFIDENGLQDKVFLLGQLLPMDMNCFWKEQDIFINLAEFEGCSLSMLEAMSYECVPVVTKVSGTNEVIVDGWNGYVCDVNDIGKIALRIVELSADKDKLKSMGIHSREIIKRKCNYDTYIDYWINIIDML